MPTISKLDKANKVGLSVNSLMIVATIYSYISFVLLTVILKIPVLSVVATFSLITVIAIAGYATKVPFLLKEESYQGQKQEIARSLIVASIFPIILSIIFPGDNIVNILETEIKIGWQWIATVILIVIAAYLYYRSIVERNKDNYNLPKPVKETEAKYLTDKREKIFEAAFSIVTVGMLIYVILIGITAINLLSFKPEGEYVLYVSPWVIFGLSFAPLIASLIMWSKADSRHKNMLTITIIVISMFYLVMPVTFALTYTQVTFNGTEIGTHWIGVIPAMVSLIPLIIRRIFLPETSATQIVEPYVQEEKWLQQQLSLNKFTEEEYLKYIEDLNMRREADFKEQQECKKYLFNKGNKEERKQSSKMYQKLLLEHLENKKLRDAYAKKLQGREHDFK